MKNSQPLVSIIVPTYNLKNTFRECLSSIKKLNYPNKEIIIVDNASTDGTAEMVKRDFKNVSLIRNKKNLGSTGGMNTGLKKAKGDYLMFVDHDNILDKNMLTEMVNYALTDSTIGIVVPKIYYWEKKNIIWAAGTSVDMVTGINIAREGEDKGQYDDVEEVSIAPANFLVSKKVIDQIGFYDDTFFVCYEDSDFCARVRKARYKIVYIPTAFCYHKFPLLSKVQSKKRWLSRAYYASRNKIVFMKKHSPYFSIFVLLYPVWFIVYTFQALKYRNLNALKNFYKGMFDGYKWAFFEYRND